MAGDWIKWEVGLARKVEVITIASILGLDRRHVAGALMELWEWADSNVTDVSRNECDSDDAFVVLRGDALRLVDGLVGVSGLADSMVSVGWLRLRDGRLEFPNLYRHNGKPGKHRALDARRQAVRRQKIKSTESPSVTETSRDERDDSVTREEKSREQSKRKEKKSAASVSPDKPPDPPKDVTSDPPVPAAENDLRRWIGEHQMLSYSPSLFSKLLQIWNHPAGGRDRVSACVEIAIKAGVSDVGPYALRVFTNQLADQAHGPRRNGKPVVVRAGQSSRRVDGGED